jgi:hypothetical protein
MALLLGAPSAWGQCPDCKWSDRGDRFEGVTSQEVSGGCCDVLAVHRKRAEPLSAKAEKLYLHFKLPEKTSPVIAVSEPVKKYLMTPKDRSYPAGLQQFSWPAKDVIAPLKIRPDMLYVRIKSADEVYFPVLVSAAPRPSAAGGYLFVLESGGEIDAECTVERAEDGRSTVVQRFPCRRSGGIFQVEWDGMIQGKAAPDGLYVLRLKGTVEVSSLKPLNLPIYFQHGRLE